MQPIIACAAAPPGAERNTRPSPEREFARARTTAVLLVAFGAVACALRVALAYRAVFGEDVVVFLDTDAWYHMRLVDNLVRNFPHRIWLDPYLLHPGHATTQVAPMLDWLIAGSALLLGAGRPSPALVDLVGAYAPPVIGALATVPVYFLGRELFSRRAGLGAAAIIGVLPGDVLIRSQLGFTDHHCLEILLTASTLALLTFALNTRLAPRRRAVHTGLAGLGLGAYLLTWSGGTFLIAILSIWGIGCLVRERLRYIEATDVVRILAGSFGIAGIMILPWVGTTRSFAREAISVTAGVVALTIFWALGHLARTRITYVSAICLTALVALIALDNLSASVLRNALGDLYRLSPSRVETVVEALPLYQSGAYPVWKQFTTSAYIALLGLTTLPSLRAATAKHMLFLTWTAVTLVATVGQVRFAYYLAISVALLAGAGCDVLLRAVARAGSRSGHSGADSRGAMRWPTLSPRLSIGAVLLGLAVVGPSLPYFRTIAASRAMSPDELDAFTWLREHTPDPFGDPDSYYRLFRGSSDGSTLAIPSYGVMAGWSRGYAMIRLARRVPNANGTQAGAGDEGAFLLAEDEDDANAILARLDTRYVMTDSLMIAGRAAAPSEFASIAQRAGHNPEEYGEEFYVRDSKDQLHPAFVYYPSYYRSMVARLQTFGGAGVTPVNSTWVISFSERRREGKLTKEIEAKWLFQRYDDAMAFVAAGGSDHLRVVSLDPLASCVPLAALRDYEPIYHSVRPRATGDGLDPPEVRVFEYRRWQPRVRPS